MDIFESLENLNISEECFDEIIDMVEEYINEVSDKTVEGALEKASDNVEASTGGISFPSKKSVDQLGRLKELANKRAERQGKTLKEIPTEYGYTYKHTMSAAQKAKTNRGKSVSKPYPLEQAEKEAKKEPNYKLGVPIKLPPLK